MQKEKQARGEKRKSGQVVTSGLCESRFKMERDPQQRPDSFYYSISEENVIEGT